VVTLFTGDLGQRLPLESRRYASWRELDYSDLRRLVGDLKQAFAVSGVDQVRIGIFTVGWGEMVLPETGEIYDLRSEWRRRHPELYGPQSDHFGRFLDPRVPLVADARAYASRPHGIAAGESYAAFLGSQWAALAGAVGLDAIHLRDGWLGQMIYRRSGPYGALGSYDPVENRSWTETMRDICAAIKAEAPGTLLLLYSSALSATAEWLTGCIDLESVIADGAVDVFVDQTWGGAWQEWWPLPTLAWTFQSAFLAGHGALIRGTDARRKVPCRHYALIETWDGWEPWDTLHRTPEKLRWATWSFAHSGVLTPDRIRVPDGMYVSWMNDPRGALISERDDGWLADAMNDAQHSAEGIERVLGPVVVHHRDALLTASEDHPSRELDVWIEDQAGMLSKFGLPVLGATRAEWLEHVDPDGVLLPLAGDAQLPSLSALAAAGRPVLLSGRADLVAEEILSAAGADADPELREQAYRPIPSRSHPDSGGYDVVHLPERAEVVAHDNAEVPLAQTDGTPVVVGRGRFSYWQAPTPVGPETGLLDAAQLGSLTPVRRRRRPTQSAADRRGSALRGTTRRGRGGDRPRLDQQGPTPSAGGEPRERMDRRQPDAARGPDPCAPCTSQWVPPPGGRPRRRGGRARRRRCGRVRGAGRPARDGAATQPGMRGTWRERSPGHRPRPRGRHGVLRPRMLWR